jgi:Na+-transporting methylmalonyl-CoA/oxaloacetate decarboxylase gamma subunit
MKKLFKTLLMLTTVFALTACGSDNGMSEVQQNKVANAEKLAVEVVQYTNSAVSSGKFDVDQYLEDYDNIELADLFSKEMELNTSVNDFNCEGKAVNSAFTSFVSGIEDMGAIVAIGSAEAEVDDDTIIVTVPVKGASGDGSVELIFTNDIYLTMTACTLNVNETMGQLMGRAAMNTLIGMGTVFVVLILISLIISLFGYIPKIQAYFVKKDNVVVTPSPAPVAAPVVAEEEEEELVDDTELVAVITAAIAAYEDSVGTASVEGFQVRSIKRARTNNWKKS